MEDTEMINLGRRLQRERERHHWTQVQLGDKINCAVPSINRWEHGKNKIKQEVIDQLSIVFGKPPERWGVGHWHVPFLRNTYFTGRDQILLRLHRALAAENTTVLSQTYAISGLGGIGKTQMALEYAFRYKNEYEAILWVQADSRETLVSDFARLAQTLDLPLQEKTEPLPMVTAVKRWLEVHGPWLLIFDNVDDLNLVSDFLLRLPVGASLLTTRSQVMGPNITKIGIARMSREEGISFLRRRSSSCGEEDLSQPLAERELQAAQELWEVMDGLPLALDQAGAYIDESQCSFCDYVDLYRDHRKDLLRERGGSILEYPASVATTWSLSFQRVEQKDPAASDLLRLSAFLSPDAIPEEILTCGAAHLTPALQEMAGSALLLNHAISTLSTYSLVRRDSTKKHFSIHRLVQAVLQDRMEAAERYMWAERAMLAVNAAFPHSEYNTWPHCEQLLTHALTAVSYRETDQIIREEAGHLLYKVASYLQNQTRYQEAEPLYQQALHVYKQQFGTEHPQVATILDSIATLYQEQGKYAKAESLYQRALSIFEQQPIPECREMATVLNHLANIYLDLGKYVEAEPFYLRALDIYEQHLGPEHPLVAYPLNGLAILSYGRGKYMEAEPLYLRALRILEQQWGPENPEVIYPLIGLGILYYVQGKYGEAEPLYLRALRILEQQWGPGHLRLTSPLNNLANLYRAQGKYGEAEPLYLRALRVLEQQLGPEHPYVGDLLLGLANLYRAQGKYGEAEPLYLRTLHIGELHLGLEHPETAEAMHDLAQFREVQGNREEARSWYERALKTREQTLGADHPKTMETHKQLINLLHEIG